MIFSTGASAGAATARRQRLPKKHLSSADGSRASAGFPGARTSRKSGLTARAIPTQAIRSAPAVVHRDMGGAKALLEYCFSCEQESGLPANMDALRKEFVQYKLGNRTDWYGNPETITDADEAKFMELLNSVTVLEGMDKPLEDILREEADAYFAGGCTAQQAAKNIQSRASLYLQEQYR